MGNRVKQKKIYFMKYKFYASKSRKIFRQFKILSKSLWIITYDRYEKTNVTKGFIWSTLDGKNYVGNRQTCNWTDFFVICFCLEHKSNYCKKIFVSWTLHTRFWKIIFLPRWAKWLVMQNTRSIFPTQESITSVT